MTPSNNRLELAVGAFLLLALATLLVLAFASTNGRVGGGGGGFRVTARFSNVGELRVRAPVKIGGVAIGQVERIELDPERFDAVVTLSLDPAFGAELPADTDAKILTAGLLGERYVGLGPGGDPEPLGDGGEIIYTQSAVVLEELIAKYIFGSGDDQEEPTGAAGSPSAMDGIQGDTP